MLPNVYIPFTARIMLRILAITLCLGLALAAPKAPQTKAVAPPKATHDDWVAPEFCNGIDCPKYTVLQANVDEVNICNLYFP